MRKQLLDTLQFSCKLEAELRGFVFGQPSSHLRENNAMVPLGPAIPRRGVAGGPGDRKYLNKLGPNLVRVHPLLAPLLREHVELIAHGLTVRGSLDAHNGGKVGISGKRVRLPLACGGRRLTLLLTRERKAAPLDQRTVAHAIQEIGKSSLLVHGEGEDSN